jgi:hypothetical protein
MKITEGLGMYDRDEWMEILEVNLDEITLKIGFRIEASRARNTLLIAKAEIVINWIERNEIPGWQIGNPKIRSCVWEVETGIRPNIAMWRRRETNDWLAFIGLSPMHLSDSGLA